MPKRALIILMKPELRAEFEKYLEDRNVKTNKDILKALRDFIEEKGIKATYLRSEDTRGDDEEDNSHSGSPLLN